MILAIRIVGQAALRRDIEETLKRLNIHRKLTATLIDANDKVMHGMMMSVRDFVAYQEVSDDVIKQLILKRGQTLDGHAIAEKDVAKIMEQIKKGEWKIKRYFRLHPPRGGFKKSTKIAYPKGILGDNKDIAKLVERML